VIDHPPGQPLEQAAVRVNVDSLLVLCGLVGAGLA